jgi:hypothetical protein
VSPEVTSLLNMSRTESEAVRLAVLFLLVLLHQFPPSKEIKKKTHAGPRR